MVRRRIAAALTLVLAMLMFNPIAWAQTATPATAGKPQAASSEPAPTLMGVLKADRPEATDLQLRILRRVHLENAQEVLAKHGYTHQFIGGWMMTQPERVLVGRAVTLRYLPVRPDLEKALKTLAKKTDDSPAYNVRAAEKTNPDEVIVVEENGLVKGAAFMDAITATGIRYHRAAGVVIDGGTRDWDTIRAWKDFPVYVRGADAAAQAAEIGVEWNGPIRIGETTVLPGDIILGTSEGIVVIPPQFVDEVIKQDEMMALRTEFQSLQMREGKYRARDVYPLNEELEKRFQEWLKERERH